MKPRKSFAEHLKTQNEIEPIQESLLSKAYAISQNAQHNSATNIVKSSATKIATLAKEAKIADETNNKLDKLSQAIIELSELLKAQNSQSTAIKNVVVASALFQTKG
jgi:hypothetical protein